MLRRLLIAAVLATLALPAAAQDFSAQRLSDGIRIISADDFQGREPGTEGERKVLDWLQAQYEALGLEPGGPDGQWLQRVELARFTPAGPPTAGWTGPDGVRHDLAPGVDINLRAAFGDGRAQVADAPLVFVGHGITAPERDWDDYGDLDVRGKVVLVLAGEPDDERFGGAYPTLYNAAWWKTREAARRGAVGVVTLAADRADSPAWTLQAAGNDRIRTEVPGREGVAFTGAVNRDVAAAWLGAAGLDVGLLDGAGGGSFRAADLTGVAVSVDVVETRSTLVTHNLLARIPGTERPDETVIFSAHWDHIGLVRHPGPDGDTVNNGAWDNASGTVAVVEMARALKAAPRPRRSIVFAHMAAEEMGLLGAYAYVADPVWPLETTVANINLDMLPLSGPTRDLPIFGFGQNTLQDRLQVLAEVQGRTVTDDGQPAQGYYYRSDHFPFALAGVPALMPWHGVDLDDGGRAVGLPAYRARFNSVYHRPGDEWSADWDLGAALENLTLLHRLALDLADGDGWPIWKAGSEFAATRAASDAARR